MLERKGARVAFVTTKGFEDTIAIGRQARPKLYDWFQPAPECLVPGELRFGVTERTSAEGDVVREVDAAELDDLVAVIQKADVDAVALSLLFSFANSRNEREVAAALERLGLPLSISHRILPEFREYERASTVVANAYLAPKMGAYLTRLAQSVESGYEKSRLEVMQSSGGIISAKLAAAEPVRTVLSGPAGGVIGAYKLAALAGFDRIIGFDMGGTSTDVCLVDASAGGLHISNESVVSGIPIGVPMLDIHTAGAGGGSIARFDAGGMLRVGPESAGAMPGPICFGRGEQPTVTDANLALGRLGTERFLGGAVKVGSWAHDALDGEGKRLDRDGGGLRGRHPAGDRDLNGQSDPRHLSRARVRSARLHAGGFWWRRPSSCLFAGACLASSAGSGACSAWGAVGGGDSVGRYDAGIFAHGDASDRCLV